jgi:hypothetical protein
MGDETTALHGRRSMGDLGTASGGGWYTFLRARSSWGNNSMGGHGHEHGRSIIRDSIGLWDEWRTGASREGLSGRREMLR